MKIVKAKMKDGYSEFEEDFEVPDNLTPQEYITQLLINFNSGRPKKEIRSLVEILNHVDKKEVYDWDAVLKDGERFIYYARRQFNNAYGNRGVERVL